MAPSLRCLLFSLVATASSPGLLHADEHFFSEVRGAETLPHGHFDAYQFTTVRTGKDDGNYTAWDFDTEIEYGITDKLQVGISTVSHFFHIRRVPELEEQDHAQFGGVELSTKYNVFSPFKDRIGLAVRFEGGYLVTDDVAGLEQEEIFLDPSIILHKNFFDDTLIFQGNAGLQFAWGKKPAEEYDYEMAYHFALGAAYRFAPGWFIGFEGRTRIEYPEFDKNNFEHGVVFIGPSLHYGAEKWWANFSYGYQIYGKGVDEPQGHTFAEEARNEFRLKVGLNF